MVKIKKRRSTHRHRVIALLLSIAFILGLTFVQVRANRASLNDSQKLLQEKQSVLEKTKKNNQRLKITVRELKDPNYLKKWIRSKYFYSEDGDIIYNFGSN